MALDEIYADPGRRAEFARQHFKDISSHYDKLIRVLSLGLDGQWRDEIVRHGCAARPKRALDIATGTGSLAIMIARGLGPEGLVAGIDFCPEMLARAREKVGRNGSRVLLSLQRAEGLAFRGRTFDLCTMGVALRHMADLKEVLAEILRVLVPGGRVVIADYSMPHGGLGGWLTRLYFFKVMPLLGFILSGDRGTYHLLKYLPVSIRSFCTAMEVARAMEEAGFAGVRRRSMGFGAVVIYSASAP